MGFSQVVKWSGQSLSVGELRHFVERIEALDDREIVFVSVDPTFNHTTDPGGTIRLSVGN